MTPTQPSVLASPNPAQAAVIRPPLTASRAVQLPDGRQLRVSTHLTLLHYLSRIRQVQG